jgi:P-type Cu2+ transporter
VWQGARVVIGSPRFIASQLTPCAQLDAPTPVSGTPVILACNGRIVAHAHFGDSIRADALPALRTLRARGWRTLLLSGDAHAVTHDVGAALGFAPDEIVAEASPEEKAAFVQARVASAGATDAPPCVAMVGDGVNDAAAIAAATVGIGVHGGAEASLSTADVALTRDGLQQLVELDTGARKVMRVIRRNIGWSLGYNVLGVGLAMTGHVTPLVAAIMMPVSSLTVVLASWLGTSFQLERR